MTKSLLLCDAAQAQWNNTIPFFISSFLLQTFYKVNQGHDISDKKRYSSGCRKRQRAHK